MENFSSAYRALTRAYDPASKKHDRTMDFLGAHVYRPLSFGLTVPFMRAGWSANQVTWLRIFVVMIAFCLLMFGQHWSVITGASLCLANVFLDLIDGNLARLQGPSAFGGFLDEITDILVKIFTPVAVSVGLYVRPDRLLSAFEVQNDTILLVGILTGLISASRAFLKSEFELRKQSYAAVCRTNTQAEETGPDTSSARISIAYVYRTGVSLMLLLLPLFAIADLLSVYICLIFASRTLAFPLELVALVLSAKNVFAKE